MPAERVLSLSPLRHTWILDLDGTLVRHNGYKTGSDEWLPGALAFLHQIPANDYVIILTARETTVRPQVERFLGDAAVRYDLIIFEMPMGERILLNDTKPSGLNCAFALSPARNVGLENVRIEIDRNL